MDRSNKGFMLVAVQGDNTPVGWFRVGAHDGEAGIRRLAASEDSGFRGITGGPQRFAFFLAVFFATFLAALFAGCFAAFSAFNFFPSGPRPVLASALM